MLLLHEAASLLGARHIPQAQAVVGRHGQPVRLRAEQALVLHISGHDLTGLCWTCLDERDEEVRVGKRGDVFMMVVSEVR